MIVNGGFLVRDAELALDPPNGRAIRNEVAN